ncbi:zf-HC2 domain-containing protein [Chitinispirillales bacterium ANBcel5]|uniref:anti-sigma factor family protein n=1 Tax=Cellulosispirillum alkaliphilum TaxID=3039283 RepID=UPI002A52328C|nr:zf-HC2 domain-containing protein [Chitinispirillales bacterium ANBcel5]
MKTEPGKLKLQLFFTGELQGDEEREIKNHLQHCEKCKAYLKELEAERKRFLNTYPFEDLAQNRKKNPVKLPLKKRRFLAYPSPLMLPAALILLLLVWIPVYMVNDSSSDETLFRYKGDSAALQFLYKRDGAIERGHRDMLFKAGDRIQILYSSLENASYVTLLSVDNLGTISFYHPNQDSDTCSVLAETGADQLFPSSIILDENAGQELIVLLYSSTPQEVDSVREWVQIEAAENYADLARLKTRLSQNLPLNGVTVASLLLTKG